MANMYNINALTYTTKDNPEWFTRALFGGRLISENRIRVLTDIKGDELLSQIDIASKVLQADGLDCAWTPNQVIKLSDKRARVKTYKINLEQCIDELEQKRIIHEMSPGAKNDALPADLEAATLKLLAIALSNEIEEMIIGGDESVDPNQINGMVKTLLLSTEATQLTTVAITKSNIVEKIEQIYDYFKEPVLQAEDAGTLFIFGSYANRRALRSGISSKTNQVLFPNWTLDESDVKNPRLYYMGVEYVPVKGIDNNTLIGIDGNNAVFLTDLLSDLESVRLGQFPAPMDNKIFIDGRLRLGFVVPFESEAIIMSTAITTDRISDDENHGLKVVPNSLVFSAAGEAKTFTVTTAAGVTPTIGAVPAGFSRAVGATTAGVTVVTVTATANAGAVAPRVAEIDVYLPSDLNHVVNVTLNQRHEDVVNIIP